MHIKKELTYEQFKWELQNLSHMTGYIINNWFAASLYEAADSQYSILDKHVTDDNNNFVGKPCPKRGFIIELKHIQPVYSSRILWLFDYFEFYRQDKNKNKLMDSEQLKEEQDYLNNNTIIASVHNNEYSLYLIRNNKPLPTEQGRQHG